MVDDRESGVIAIDLVTGQLGPLIAVREPDTPLHGILEKGQPFVTRDGRRAYIVGPEGRLKRYSL